MLKITVSDHRGTVEATFQGDLPPEEAARQARAFINEYNGETVEAGNPIGKDPVPSRPLPPDVIRRSDVDTLQGGPSRLEVAQQLTAIADKLYDSL